MNPEKISVLFMDDEIGDGTAIMVSDAIEALKCRATMWTASIQCPLRSTLSTISSTRSLCWTSI